MVYQLFDREYGYWWSNGKNIKAVDVWGACHPKFAQYEIEQQVCLLEYLMVLISKSDLSTPGFNEIVQHDVAWSRLGVDLITSMNSMLGEQILLRGLDTLRLPVEARNYQNIHKALHRGESWTDGPLH
ncbi:unnamed protein product [Clonostachys chloroleuca]|uniref:Uncharacterized protein n=1 Tax=Clonostachys chloroleuca TaxID=1926264 RepID=A0AA35Q566_9HYPO|nr:unnamed protein product [Clonostachys chloroleuca]